MLNVGFKSVSYRLSWKIHAFGSQQWKHDPLPSRMVEVRKLASSDKGERHIGGNHIGLGWGWEGLRGVLELSHAFGGLPFGFLKVEKEGFRIRKAAFL